MSSSLANRIQQVADTPRQKKGACVVYVMSRDQRIQDNHALYAAQLEAKKHQLPLVVTCMLYGSSKVRSFEHMVFMLEGLNELADALQTYGIPFIVRVGKRELADLCKQLHPQAIYADMSPLRGAKRRVAALADLHIAPVYVVDTHNIVPVWSTSEKQEYAARTIRPKIHRNLSSFLQEVPEPFVQMYPDSLLSGIPTNLPLDFLPQLSYKKSHILHRFKAGEKAAHDTLEDFINMRLRGYHVQRNDPSVDGLSNLSPYLHFGQISSLAVVLRAQRALAEDASLQPDVDTLVEEIVVRKELSDNFCYYNASYDSLSGAPNWAQSTLRQHEPDEREFLYTRDQFERAETHDQAWNAAQKELTSTGKMHGYMRMYWAKKVLEWSTDAREAHATLCYLNDFYSMDGGDPSGYVGILWSVAGLHDRPWQERPVYGTVRSMVYAGLKRKFDIQAYIDKFIK